MAHRRAPSATRRRRSRGVIRYSTPLPVRLLDVHADADGRGVVIEYTPVGPAWNGDLQPVMALVLTISEAALLRRFIEGGPIWLEPLRGEGRSREAAAAARARERNLVLIQIAIGVLLLAVGALKSPDWIALVPISIGGGLIGASLAFLKDLAR